MSKRNWMTLALYALGMAFLIVGVAMGNDPCITVAVGLILGSVVVQLLEGHVLHLHVNVFMDGDKRGDDE